KVAPPPHPWRSLLRSIYNSRHGTHNRVYLLRFLFPHVAQRTRTRLWTFQYSYLSTLKQRAQGRIFQYLLAKHKRRQQRTRERTSSSGSVILRSLRRQGLIFRHGRIVKNGSLAARRADKMSYYGAASGQGGLAYGDFMGGDDREPGRRRRKIAGFLKAANEVRQSYFSGGETNSSHDAGGVEGPGAFPEAAVVRSGNEEMILFPSYARWHVKRQAENMPGSNQSEQEFWAREWEKHQNDKALVDVDVRGWIYIPQRGQHTRRQRLLIGIARQLSGISAPSAGSASDSVYSSQAPSRATSPTRGVSKQDEDLISFETESILKRGEAETRNAARGKYSEKPRDADEDSVYGRQSQEASPVRGSRTSTYSVASSDVGISPPVSPTIAPLSKRASGTQPSKMSQSELSTANMHLLHRLKPFMHTGLQNTAISAFFYNEQASRQLTVYTDASGHFAFHAALDFVPTHVRVLGGENLSATEEIIITSPKGVSLISDIDDTIKHSGITGGAREIFRNAFIRDLGDMTIDGVKEWYNTLHDMGVKVHYVSNSPWQMYPILATYFKMAGLPRGSFHLKQYTGALAGIFEPVAERKKSSLSKIMRDFPERKFILVGDSGEADLEVYTDVAVDNPGRVLGVFIRDVTSSTKSGYFDPSGTPESSAKQSRNHSRNRSSDTLAMSKRLARPNDIKNDDADLEAAIALSLKDMEQETRMARRSINPDAPGLPGRFDSTEDRMPKPALPQCPPRHSGWTDLDARMSLSPEQGDLIDFSDEKPPSKPWLEPPAPRRSLSPSSIKMNGSIKGVKPSPSPPPKPQALRSPSPTPPEGQQSAFKAPPPRPRKPSSAVTAPSVQQLLQHDGTHSPMPSRQKPQTSLNTQVPPTHAQPVQPSPLSQVTSQSPITSRRPDLPQRPRTFQKVTSVVGSALKGGQSASGTSSPMLPTNSTALTLELPRPMSGNLTSRSIEEMRSEGGPTLRASLNGPPLPPPRRTGTGVSLMSTSTRASTNKPGGKDRLSGAWEDLSDGLPTSPGDAGMSKKEWLWQQRLAKAKQILEPRGVTVRTWRIGADVADVAVKLVEMELRQIEKEGRQNGDTYDVSVEAADAQNGDMAPSCALTICNQTISLAGQNLTVTSTAPASTQVSTEVVYNNTVIYTLPASTTVQITTLIWRTTLPASTIIETSTQNLTQTTTISPLTLTQTTTSVQPASTVVSTYNVNITQIFTVPASTVKTSLYITTTTSLPTGTRTTSIPPSRITETLNITLPASTATSTYVTTYVTTISNAAMNFESFARQNAADRATGTTLTTTTVSNVPTTAISTLIATTSVPVQTQTATSLLYRDKHSTAADRHQYFGIYVRDNAVFNLDNLPDGYDHGSPSNEHSYFYNSHDSAGSDEHTSSDKADLFLQHSACIDDNYHIFLHNYYASDLYQRAAGKHWLSHRHAHCYSNDHAASHNNDSKRHFNNGPNRHKYFSSDLDSNLNCLREHRRLNSSKLLDHNLFDDSYGHGHFDGNHLCHPDCETVTSITTNTRNTFTTTNTRNTFTTTATATSYASTQTLLANPVCPGNTGQIYKSNPGPEYQLACNYDSPNYDLQSFYITTGFNHYQTCIDTCGNTTVCLGVAFDISGQQECWLKSASITASGVATSRALAIYVTGT
ncbi:actin patch protein 1, partial [Teratosphaeria destructans]